ADAVVHLVDVQAEIADAARQAQPADHRSVEDTRTIVAGLKAAGAQAILALNKIDGVKRDSLLAIADNLFQSGVYSEVFMISASTGSGVDDLKDRLAAMMPEGPWLYPEEQSADV